MAYKRAAPPARPGQRGEDQSHDDSPVPTPGESVNLRLARFMVGGITRREARTCRHARSLSVAADAFLAWAVSAEARFLLSLAVFNARCAEGVLP